MSRDPNTYVALIQPEHKGKPNFVATVDLNTQPYLNLQVLFESMPGLFDLDVAVGDQLDAVGERIGLTRYVRAPLANLYFSWSDPLRGWGRGLWYDADYGNEYGVTALDDETYRRLLRAKILANQWDGTLPGAQAIVDEFFASPGTTLAMVQDDASSAGQNVFFAWGDPNAGWGYGQWFALGDTVATVESVQVGFTIGVAGKLPPLPLLFLLEQQLVPVKAVGAPVRYAFTSVDNTPLFGWGVSNDYIAGWGAGAWGVDAETILDAPPGSVYPVSEAA